MVELDDAMGKSEAKLTAVIAASDDFNTARLSSVIRNCTNFTGLALVVGANTFLVFLDALAS
jgi:hypothetical protein